MTALNERVVLVNGEPCRVWEKGEGEPVVVLAGPYGAASWSPFFEALAGTRRVMVPSLPGFPGGGSGHEQLDDFADWVCTTLDLLDGSAAGAVDLIGCSVGGALAAEVAALSPGRVRSLVLIAPFGLHDADIPVANLWARRTSDVHRRLCHDGELLDAFFATPEGVDPVEWEMLRTRSLTAGARLMWPLCDLGLAKRLHRITVPTLIIWGQEDEVIDPAYAGRWAARLPAARAELVAGAGHLADVDQPDVVAACIDGFLSEQAPLALAR